MTPFEHIFILFVFILIGVGIPAWMCYSMMTEDDKDKNKSSFQSQMDSHGGC